MGTLYEQNIQREATMCSLRDDIIAHFSRAAQSKKNAGAAEQKKAFETAFTAEHKAFLAFRDNASATQSDFNRHFDKAQNLLDTYMRLYNTSYNDGINAFFLTREEASRYKEQVKQKMKTLQAEASDYNRRLYAKYNQSTTFYHNANSLIQRLEKEIRETVDNEFYAISHTDTKAFANYVSIIFGRYSHYCTWFKDIKANAWPFC